MNFNKNNLGVAFGQAFRFNLFSFLKKDFHYNPYRKF
jgi:hypothetical protein